MLTVNVSGQNPNVQDDFYKGALRSQGDNISFCIWDRAATRDFDQDVAQEIASILLLNSEFFLIEQARDLSGEELLQLVFIVLSDECDVVMGFQLITEIYPEWLAPTRSYLKAPYVAAVTSTDYERLVDVPPGSLIGSQVYTQADNQLIALLRSLGDRAWRRFPYDDPVMMLDHLNQGVLSAAIIWGPRATSLMHQGAVPEGVRFVSLDGALGAVAENIGGMAFSRNRWVIGEIDAAIRVLIEAGVISELIEKHGLIGEPPTLR